MVLCERIVFNTVHTGEKLVSYKYFNHLNILLQFAATFVYIVDI